MGKPQLESSVRNLQRFMPAQHEKEVNKHLKTAKRILTLDSQKEMRKVTS